MYESAVLDRVFVELVIPQGATKEVQREILRRLDGSTFFTHVLSVIQQAVNAADMDDVQVVVRR